MLTLTEYKNYIGINSPNNDTQLEPLIAYVNDFVERYCNLSLEVVTVENERHIAGNGEVQLKGYPVQSITEVKVRGEVRTDYIEDEGLLILSKTNYWDEVFVSYSYGFTTIPDGLKIPAMELVTYFYKKDYNKTQTLGSTGETITSADYLIIPAHVRAGLELYRCP